MRAVAAWPSFDYTVKEVLRRLNLKIGSAGIADGGRIFAVWCPHVSKGKVQKRSNSIDRIALGRHSSFGRDKSTNSA
jgi:hypothetical protein